MGLYNLGVTLKKNSLNGRYCGNKAKTFYGEIKKYLAGNFYKRMSINVQFYNLTLKGGMGGGGGINIFTKR